MNRTHHLKSTLLKNIIDNSDYEHLEFLILDYNSQDDLEIWIRQHFGAYIQSGRLVYYKTFQPVIFDHSHSKNMAFRLATGDIVGNINADVFLGKGFATYINTHFQEDASIFMHPEPGLNFGSGASGIICLNKRDFHLIEGFDERMKVYGWEDIDFQNRLVNAGINRTFISDEQFCNAIDHPDKYDKPNLFSKIHSIYIDRIILVDNRYISVLMLFNNSTFKLGTIVNNAVQMDLNTGYVGLGKEMHREYFQFELVEERWNQGSWTCCVEGISLQSYSNSEEIIRLALPSEDIIWMTEDKEDHIFFRVRNPYTFDWLAYFEMDYENRLYMLKNKREKCTAVNQSIYGTGEVFCNFNLSVPLLLS